MAIDPYCPEGQLIMFEVSPLLEASANADRESCLQLLAAGADVNAADPVTGDTGLHIAVMNNFRPLVAFFLRSGADPDRKNVKGITPRSVASSLGGTMEQMFLSADRSRKRVEDARKTRAPDKHAETATAVADEAPNQRPGGMNAPVWRPSMRPGR